MATYLIRKDRFAAIEWTGSNLADVQYFVARLPELDNYYAQFTGATVSAVGSICTVSWSGVGGGSIALDVGGLLVEGAVSSGGFVVDGTNHPTHYRIDI